MGLYAEIRCQTRRGAEVRTARRPAVRERRHSHRARLQQDPERHGRAVAHDGRLRRAVRPGLGLSRSADRTERRARARRGRQGSVAALSRFRRACRAFAFQVPRLAAQRTDFKRLGVLGDWEHPYRTMDFGYQAAIVRALGKFVARGLVYKGKKPVHWCLRDRTALAEAEVEYEPHVSPSIYVEFPLSADGAATTRRAQCRPSAAARRARLIWTTTPWTIPANLAIAFHPDVDYGAYENTTIRTRRPRHGPSCSSPWRWPTRCRRRQGARSAPASRRRFKGATLERACCFGTRCTTATRSACWPRALLPLDQGTRVWSTRLHGSRRRRLQYWRPLWSSEDLRADRPRRPLRGERRCRRRSQGLRGQSRRRGGAPRAGADDSGIALVSSTPIRTAGAVISP